MASAGDDFLTVAEVADVLKLNQQTVRNWIDRGELPALRVGRRVRIRRADFHEMLERGYTGTPASTAGGGFNGADFWSGELHPQAVVGPEPT